MSAFLARMAGAFVGIHTSPDERAIASLGRLGCRQSHNPLCEFHEAMLILCLKIRKNLCTDTSLSAGCAQMGWYDKFR